MAIAASIIAVMPRVHELSFEPIGSGFSVTISEVISCLSQLSKKNLTPISVQRTKKQSDNPVIVGTMLGETN
jgi:hypothetical protein